MKGGRGRVRRIACHISIDRKRKVWKAFWNSPPMADTGQGQRVSELLSLTLSHSSSLFSLIGKIWFKGLFPNLLTEYGKAQARVKSWHSHLLFANCTVCFLWRTSMALVFSGKDKEYALKQWHSSTLEWQPLCSQ